MTATTIAPARVELTEEQATAADALIRGAKRREALQTLGGYAGTGKTVLVSKLADALPGFGVCAYTGKAADILRRKGLYGASTIHSLIYRPETDHRGKTVFSLRRPQEVSYSGFLVDEASMVSGDILKDLRSLGRPIIAVGDHGQLPPVGNDAGLMRDPQYRLETIHRNAGQIARFAEFLRKGGEPRDWREPPAVGESRVYVLPAAEATEARLLAADQVICAYNKTRVQLNRTIRRALGRKDDATPEAGDRVMCLRNNRLAGVFNGQQGVALSIRTRGLEMEFQPTYGMRTWVNYHPEGFDREKPPEYEKHGGRFGTEVAPIPFDFAYAATCHKCQGDEFGKVIVMEEKCGMWEHSRWCYTAASRAKIALLWILQ